MTDETTGNNAVELATELTIAWLSNPNTRAAGDDVPAFLRTMHEAGFIRNPELGDVEDDQYNLVIVDKSTREPVFAIVYGTNL